MPTYEYECSKCKKTFEMFQSMKDPVLKTCPKDLCRKKTWGKGAVTRLLGSGAGLIFKGSGFYITDYRSSNYKDAAKKESSSSNSSKSSETKSSGGADKKTSAKKD